ncbi:MAG: trigger factor [Candidatus Promineifilaceae bacterium]
MTLNIHTEEDSERQLKVTVEVPEERVQEQMRRTARSLAKRVRIPGFRKGKVPYNVLVNRVGEETLRADAIEEMIEPIFMEALDDIGEQPFRQPTLDDIQFDPLVLELTVPLEPTVKLGEYRTERKDLAEVVVTEEALENALEQLQASFQELEEVDKPAELGDMITISGQGKLVEEPGEIIFSEQDRDLLLDPEKTMPDLPFVENLTGLAAGDETEFTVAFAEEHEDEDLAGKEVAFSVSVSKVQNRTLPELDDDLAKQAGEYETFEELTEALEEQLFEQAKNDARNELLDEWVDILLADAEIVYPPAIVESELDKMVSDYKEQVTRSGWQWEDFLKLQGESEDSLRESWREGAASRIKRGIVLREFAEVEFIKVNASDVDDMLDNRVNRYGDNPELKEQIRNVLSQGQGLESIRNDILMEKVVDRIEAIVTGTAPDLDELESMIDGDDDEEE